MATAPAAGAAAELISTGELAACLGVHRTTITLWIRTERLKPDQLTLGGHARFRRDTAKRLRAAMQGGARAA